MDDTTYIITDRDGREIGFCTGSFEDACDLRDCIGGYDVVDASEYEEPEEEDEEYGDLED